MAMPKYLFHFHDGPLETKHEFPDDAAARRQAIVSLCDVAREEVPLDGDLIGLSVFVTDEAGHALFSATLDFRVDAVAKPPPYEGASKARLG